MQTKRICMALDLKNDPVLISEYEHFHTPGHIWPEIPLGLKEGGIVDLQIYRIGNHLFMIVEILETESIDRVFRKINQLPRQLEWNLFMGRFQQRLLEAQPHEHWATMKPVFLLKDHLT